jgi:hypothetical protein
MSVVKQQDVIRVLSRDRKVFKTSKIAAADVDLRNVVTTSPDSFSYPGKIDFTLPVPMYMRVTSKPLLMSRA